MNDFEKTKSILMHDIKQYNYIEFFHENQTPKSKKEFREIDNR